MTESTTPAPTLAERIRVELARDKNKEGLTGAEIVKAVNYTAAQHGPIYRAIRQLVDGGFATNKDAKRKVGTGDDAKEKSVRVTKISAKGKKTQIKRQVAVPPKASGGKSTGNSSGSADAAKTTVTNTAATSGGDNVGSGEPAGAPTGAEA